MYLVGRWFEQHIKCIYLEGDQLKEKVFIFEHNGSAFVIGALEAQFESFRSCILWKKMFLEFKLVKYIPNLHNNGFYISSNAVQLSKLVFDDSVLQWMNFRRNT